MHDQSRPDRRRIVSGGLAALAATACGQVASARPIHNVRDFGAIGDGMADDAPAFQRAIDAAARTGGTLSFGPGTYLLRYRPAEDGDGVTALTLRSGVTLEGTDRTRCILRLADDQMGPGTYARIIGSRGEIASAGLRRFTIDGNREGQGQFGNDISGAAVLLGWKGRCIDVIVEELTVRGPVGQGIMLQGSIGNVSRNLRIAGNHIRQSSFIGIQCSQFDGVAIVDNRVEDCHDNGIDIYGDDTVGHSTVATSHRATISGNEIRQCSIGIFLETVADSTARNNLVADCRGAGVRINRIHGEPRNLTIIGNRIEGTPTGVAMGGETGGVMIRDNDIRGFTVAGIEFGYFVARVSATGNRFRPRNAKVPIVLATPNIPDAVPAERLLAIRIRDNRIPRGHDPARLFVNRYRSLVDVAVDGFVDDLD
jgi:parallel beta-helix repeat protein